MNFDDIDLQGGEATFIEPLGEDMLEVRYANGYMVDVGFIDKEKTYYVTIVKDDNWKNAVAVYKARTEIGTRQNIKKAIEYVQKLIHL